MSKSANKDKEGIIMSLDQLKEKDIKNKIKSGENFILLLNYRESTRDYGLIARTQGVSYDIVNWRGGVKIIKDANKVIDWARTMGFSSMRLEVNF